MVSARLTIWSIAALAASVSVSRAGPCQADIDAMQARIDARVEAIAAAGPTAKEGGFAGMSAQPTPRSLARAEVKLGELSPRAAATVEHAMARARKDDAAGLKGRCERALAMVRRALAK